MRIVSQLSFWSGCVLVLGGVTYLAGAYRDEQMRISDGHLSLLNGLSKWEAIGCGAVCTSQLSFKDFQDFKRPSYVQTLNDYLVYDS